MGVGMPFSLLLQQFGEHIYHAFGHIAYHVGSSLGNEKTAWRDVDVRVMLPDDEYERLGFGTVKDFPQNTHMNGKWVSTVLAWSCFGKQLTGLPIDFQIQPLGWANANEGASRSALFDLVNVQHIHENSASMRQGERERVLSLIAAKRHASDEELAGFVLNPPDWHE